MYYYGDIGPCDDQSLIRITFVVIEKRGAGWAKLRIVRIESLAEGCQVEINDCSDITDEHDTNIKLITFIGRTKLINGVETYLINYPAIEPGFRIALKATEEFVALKDDNFIPSPFYPSGI